MIRTRFLAGLFMILGSVVNVAQAGNYFNGFETDETCWFDATRVASGGGTLSLASATGSWHAESIPGAYTKFGGYGDGDTCDSVSASLQFPEAGYRTAVDVYLDVNGQFTNAALLDYTAAINNPAGDHRRDFIFNCGFYNDDQTATSLGSGNRFICSASNNAPGWPVNPDREPTVVATASGWYTFRHRFYDDGFGVLAVDLTVLDSTGTEIKTWTLSDATDLINVTVGGNRYGWFATNQLGTLAIDNSSRDDIASIEGQGVEEESLTPIPTLGHLALMLLAGLMLLGGISGIRRSA